MNKEEQKEVTEPIKRTVIYEVTNYEDASGRKVNAKSAIPVDYCGSLPVTLGSDEPDTLFEGQASIQVHQVDPTGRPTGNITSKPFKFGIEADTLGEAFSRFDEIATNVVKEMEESHRKQQNNIIVPNSSQLPGGNIV